MAKHWVYKEIYSNRYLCNGKAVDFEPLDGNSGVGVFVDGKDDEVIKCLQHAASKQMGGIVFITEDEYSKKKQERPFSPQLELQRQEKLRVMPHRPFAPREPGAAGDDLKQAVEQAKAVPATQAAPAPLITPAPVSPSPGEAQVAVAAAPGFKPATRRMARKKAA